MDTRLRFLEQFLGALGAQRIEWSSIEAGHVRGTVVYDEAEPEEEHQDFLWEISEAEAPPDELVSLVAMIRAQDLLSIDKLMVGSNELRKRFCAHSGRIYNSEEFERLLEALESIRVPMLDAGLKGDAYFIHQ